MQVTMDAMEVKELLEKKVESLRKRYEFEEAAVYAKIHLQMEREKKEKEEYNNLSFWKKLLSHVPEQGKYLCFIFPERDFVLEELERWKKCLALVKEGVHFSFTDEEWRELNK